MYIYIYKQLHLIDVYIHMCVCMCMYICMYAYIDLYRRVCIKESGE